MAYTASKGDTVHLISWHQIPGGDPMPLDPDKWTGVVEKTGKKITVRRDSDGCLQECKPSEVYKG
jgi:hypothetical protein